MEHQYYKKKPQPKREIWEPPKEHEGFNRKERRMKEALFRRSTKGPRSGK